MKIDTLSATKRYIPKLLILLIATTMLTGCTVKWVYNQLDWLVPIYVRTFIKLTPDQKDYLASAIDHQLLWHRQEELPKYVVYLNKIKQNLEKGLTIEQLHTQNQELEEFGNTLLTRLSPDIAELIATSSDRQLERLFNKLNKEYLKSKRQLEKSDDAKIRRDHRKGMENYLKRWLGSLTDQQVKLLDRWTQQYTPIEKELLQHQFDWQQRLRKIVEETIDDETKKSQLALLFVDSDQFVDKAYQSKIDHNTKITEDLVVATSKSLTPRQLKRAHKKIDELVEDLEDLYDK